jgi:predicted PurR-regulated permease PerM
MSHKDSQEVIVHINTGTMVKGLLLLLLVAALYFLKDLVLIVLTAIVIASAIEPAARWFMKFKIPRVFAVLFVYVIVLVSIFGILYLFLPPILEEAFNFFGTLPMYLESLEQLNPFTGSGLLGDVGESGFSIKETLESVQTYISSIAGGVLGTVSVVFGGLMSLILIIVFSFYFAVQETGVDDFLRVVTPIKHQKYVLNLWKRSQFKIGRWMQGQLMLALIVGILVYLGLTILGVKYALLLALVAGVFELIPVFGPILSAIPAVLFGFVDGGVTLGLLVIGLYLIIQQFENHLIYPLVVTKVVGVPPLLVILALIIGAQVAGFLGVILSVPVAAAIQEFVKDVERNKDIQLRKEATTD